MSIYKILLSNALSLGGWFAACNYVQTLKKEITKKYKNQYILIIFLIVLFMLGYFRYTIRKMFSITDKGEADDPIKL